MAVMPGPVRIERGDYHRENLRDADAHVGNPDRQPVPGRDEVDLALWLADRDRAGEFFELPR